MAVLPLGDRIALAHVVRGAGVRPEVRLLASFRVEVSEVDALRRLRTACQLKAYACTTLMGNGEYHVTQLEAPLVPQAERKEALRWALRDMVSYPLESACVDVLEVPNQALPPGRSAGVLVVSAAEQAVRSRVAGFEKAKTGLDAVDVPELAQRNVAALLEDENRSLAFLRIDEAGMMLTLTFQGELIAVRSGVMNTLELNGGTQDQRVRVREHLLLDVQRSLDHFDRQFSRIPISRLILASYPPVENLAAELGENIDVPVQEMDLSSVMDFPVVPELRDRHCQAKNLLAIGAALRTAGTTSTTGTTPGAAEELA